MDNKKIIKALPFAGIFVGFTLSGFLYKYFGINKDQSRLIVIVIGTAIFLSGIMYLIYKKYYLGALKIILPMLSIFIGIVGSYIDNMYMMIGGLIGFFIIGIIIIKTSSK